MTQTPPTGADEPRPDVDAQMAAIDGINGVADMPLTDPTLREIVRRQLAGEITGDEARELGRKHLRT